MIVLQLTLLDLEDITGEEKIVMTQIQIFILVKKIVMSKQALIIIVMELLELMKMD